MLCIAFSCIDVALLVCLIFSICAILDVLVRAFKWSGWITFLFSIFDNFLSISPKCWVIEFWLDGRNEVDTDMLFSTYQELRATIHILCLFPCYIFHSYFDWLWTTNDFHICFPFIRVHVQWISSSNLVANHLMTWSFFFSFCQAAAAAQAGASVIQIFVGRVRVIFHL